ncbi:MAG TPA: HAMP domain-containing protein, partial [Lachnospiraceae bacterium]|nr:HAMP domain-containing protein [Lachnospiraceae bacterium]
MKDKRKRNKRKALQIKIPKVKPAPIKFNKLNNKLPNSISLKLLGVFGITMFFMLLLMIVFFAKALGYNQEYQQVLENVNKINYIKTEISEQPNRMMSLCMMQNNVGESGEVEIVKTMLADLDEISASIGDNAAFQGNQGMIVSIKTPLTDYQTILTEIVDAGTNGCFPPLDTDTTAKVQGLFGLNASIANYCGSLITMEVERSEVVQKEVNQNFRRTIIIVGILFLLLLSVGMALCTIVVKSITRRIHRLKNEISIVAQGDLSREDIVIGSNDEIKELAVAFNHMSGSLRKIIGKMAQVTDEMDRSTQIVSSSAESNS